MLVKIMLPITPNKEDFRLGKIRGPQEERLFRTKEASWGLRLLTTFWLEVPPCLTSACPVVFSLLRVLAWKPPFQVSCGLPLGHRFNLLGDSSHGSGQKRKATNSCWLSNCQEWLMFLCVSTSYFWRAHLLNSPSLPDPMRTPLGTVLLETCKMKYFHL